MPLIDRRSFLVRSPCPRGTHTVGPAADQRTEGFMDLAFGVLADNAQVDALGKLFRGSPFSTEQVYAATAVLPSKVFKGKAAPGAQCESRHLNRERGTASGSR